MVLIKIDNVKNNSSGLIWIQYIMSGSF
jgi:hypothetical protein